MDDTRESVSDTDNSSQPTQDTPHPRRTFRMFFFRGLGVLLPSILTIWLLVLAFNFVTEKIADPINRGIRYLVVYTTDWPTATKNNYEEAIDTFNKTDRYQAERAQWQVIVNDRAELAGQAWTEAEQQQQKRLWLDKQTWYHRLARQVALKNRWESVTVFGYPPMNLVGLVVAVFVMYFAGLFLGSYFGKRIYKRGEDVLKRTPVFKQVYPHVKQVTDFFVGDEEKKKLKFDTVVAVEYPRKGLWSLGLVTGDTLQTIQNSAGEQCMTVFIPSSPTPFTGYVVTVPKRDTIQLNISIDDALRFTVSGGVIVPESQLIHHTGQLPERGGKAPTAAAVTANGENV